MDKVERLHRPDLDRDEPIRDMMTYIRNSGLGSRAEATPPEPGGNASGDDTVSHGVKLGYAVIEDQIRQGKLLAERLGRVDGKSAAMPPVELGMLIERTLNIYKDMGALCVAAVETLVRSPAVKAGVARVWPGTARTEAAPASSTGSEFGFELISSRHTHVTVDIRSRPANFLPHVHALHATNPAFPPITLARFKLNTATMAPTLVVEIPDTQPAATYTGVVVDASTNEPCGTLSIRILP